MTHRAYYNEHDPFAAAWLRELIADGLIAPQYGQDHAHASLSARQAKEKALMMSGTSGRHFNGSSNSADLQLLLESKLRAKSQILGSILFKLTWRRWVTPSGVSRSRLRASVPRISVTAHTGWHTPVVRDYRNSSGNGENPRDLPRQAFLAGWTTPITHDTHPRGAGNRENTKGGNACLAWDAKLASWPTPMAGTPAQNGNNAAGNTDSSRLTVDLSRVGHPARLTASGKMLIGSDAQTISGGQLNPAHSLWLMVGHFATAWASCGERVTRSRSGKRKPSSNA